MSCHIQCLGGACITTKHTTGWPKTNFLAFETDFKKRRFFEPFSVNTNDNVINSKSNDSYTSVRNSEFGEKPHNIVNDGLPLMSGDTVAN